MTLYKETEWEKRYIDDTLYCWSCKAKLLVDNRLVKCIDCNEKSYIYFNPPTGVYTIHKIDETINNKSLLSDIVRTISPLRWSND